MIKASSLDRTAAWLPVGAQTWTKPRPISHARCTITTSLQAPSFIYHASRNLPALQDIKLGHPLV